MRRSALKVNNNEFNTKSIGTNTPLSLIQTSGTLTPIAPINLSYTTFSPSSDTKMFYVNSLIGNDTNDGLTPTSAKKTLNAGFNLLRNGFPDWLIVKGGTTYHESVNWNKFGRSSTERMIIKSDNNTSFKVYTGISDGISIGVFTTPAKGNLAICDCDFYADGYNGSNAQPSAIHALGYLTNILVENVRAFGYCANFVFDSEEGGMSNISLRFIGSFDAYRVGPEVHAQGLYIAGCDTVLLENSYFDHNGWSENITGAIPTIFRHNIYIQGHEGQPNDCKNVTVRNILSMRAGATGMQQRPGGLCSDSLFIANPLNLVFGTTGGTIYNCVTTGSRDIDSSNPRGVGFNIVNGSNFIVDHCLALGDPTTMGSQNVYGYAIDTATNVTIKNSVSWNWKNSSGIGSPVNASNAPNPILINCNMQQVAPTLVKTIETYMSSLGKPATIAALANEIRLQSKDNLRSQYLPNNIITYLMIPFGMSTKFLADFDGDGQLTFADFGAFLQAYSAGDPRANIDGSTMSPMINVADLTAFLQAYSNRTLVSN